MDSVIHKNGKQRHLNPVLPSYPRFQLVLAEKELSLVTVDAEEVVVVFVWLALNDDTCSILVIEKMKLFSFKAIKRKTLATIQAINRIIFIIANGLLLCF